jgi:aminobenzoyl-glutamate utilization protein B
MNVETIAAAVERPRETLTELARDIWEHPQTAFEESTRPTG